LIPAITFMNVKTEELHWNLSRRLLIVFCTVMILSNTPRTDE